MTIEAAGYIIRRRPQDAREAEIVQNAFATLGLAGYSDRDASIQAQRDLSRTELLILEAGRSCR